MNYDQLVAVRFSRFWCYQIIKHHIEHGLTDIDADSELVSALSGIAHALYDKGLLAKANVIRKTRAGVPIIEVLVRPQNVIVRA